jgi:hypothetical protein
VPGQRNAVWQMFTVPACCSVIGDRPHELRAMVGHVRAAYGRHLAEPAWTSFVDSLVAASPEFAALWATHDVVGPVTTVKTFIYESGRPVRVTATPFSVAAAPEARMVVYVPVTDEDRRRLVEITADPPGIRLCAGHAAQGQA